MEKRLEEILSNMRHLAIYNSVPIEKDAEFIAEIERLIWQTKEIAKKYNICI